MRYVLALLSALLGIGMLVTGVQLSEVLTHTVGEYYAIGHVPWAYLFVLAHVNPPFMTLALALLALGVGWLIHAYYIFCNARNRAATTLLCVLTLWFFPFGTILAIVELCILWFSPKRSLA